MKGFDEFYSWQKAQDLAVGVFKVFSDVKDLEFVKNVKKVSVAVSGEIAKGYERQYDIDFKLALLEAKGRCGQLRSMLFLAKKMEYIGQGSFDDLNKIVGEVLGLVGGLIKSMKEKASKKSK